MRLIVRAATALLVCSALPAFSLGHSTPHHAPRDARRAAAAPADSPPALPATVYGDASSQPENIVGGPEVVVAGTRQPASPGQAETIYGDVPPVHVYEIALANLAPAEGRDEARDKAAALPLTVVETGSNLAAEGMPETVYAGDWHPGPVNEAQLAANEISGDGMTAEPDTEPGIDSEPAENTAEAAGDQAEVAPCPPEYYLPRENGLPLFRNAPGLPLETASPYSRYTDAQRAGMNPCEEQAAWAVAV